MNGHAWIRCRRLTSGWLSRNCSVLKARALGESSTSAALNAARSGCDSGSAARSIRAFVAGSGARSFAGFSSQRAHARSATSSLCTPDCSTARGSGVVSGGVGGSRAQAHGGSNARTMAENTGRRFRCGRLIVRHGAAFIVGDPIAPSAKRRLCVTSQSAAEGAGIEARCPLCRESSCTAWAARSGAVVGNRFARPEPATHADQQSHELHQTDTGQARRPNPAASRERARDSSRR